MVLRVIIVPDLANGARIRGDWTWQRYTQIDQASYDYADAIDEPALADLALRAASRVANRELKLGETRALRLHPGDYLLAHHDRVHEGYPLEVVFDLSEREVPGAEVHYRRRGNVFFRFSSQPGAASIVERGPTVTCNHTYVSRRQDATVTRVVMLLW
jgi:hypothetical protein